VKSRKHMPVAVHVLCCKTRVAAYVALKQHQSMQCLMANTFELAQIPNVSNLELAPRCTPSKEWEHQLPHKSTT